MMIETLEDRRLLSVSVTQGAPGIYEIVSDDAAACISAEISQEDAAFTLDGTTYTDVSYIYVTTGGGDDTVYLTSLDGSGPIGASISTNGGNDTVHLNFDGAIWGGSGNDELHLANAWQGQVFGENGADRIYISGDCVDADIQGGDGNDLIDASDNAYNVVEHGGNGSDTLFGSAYDDQLFGEAGSDLLVGDGGNDTFYSGTGGGDSVYGDEGNDILYSNHAEAVTYNIDQFIYP